MTTNPLHFSLLILLLSTTTYAKKLDLVRTSCLHASYPEICAKTLSIPGNSAKTPRELAALAVRVSVAHVCTATDFLSRLKTIGARERGAVRDCLEQMGDSVEELSKTLTALKDLRRDADFRWQMSNAQTWVSAALTNENTCLDGFKEISGNVRSDVRRRVNNVARVTSNALYLINLLDESRG